MGEVVRADFNQMAVDQNDQSDAPSLHEGDILLSSGVTVDPQAAERFRMLRARIERKNLAGDDIRVIAMTSAVPEEGKSVVSVNLSRALGIDPVGKTLLIDCDLRRPNVHHFFQMDPAPGLSDMLVRGTSLREIVRSVEPGLDVITAGSRLVDPTRAIEQPLFSRLLRELRQAYRYVILDCPPVLLCPEPISLTSLADKGMMVVRGWQTQKRLVKDAVAILGKERLMGVVMNDSSDAVNDYGYYHYYGYDRTLSKRGGTKRTPDKMTASKAAPAKTPQQKTKEPAAKKDKPKVEKKKFSLFGRKK